MKQLFILPLVLTAVVAIPLQGKEQCAKGPKIWCQNIRTASQCGAIDHCRQTVWNKPTVRNMPCELCKEVLSVVINILKNNDTQALIEEYLDKVCELLPGKSSSECEEMVEEYLPIIIDFLKEELADPGEICSLLGLCQSLQQHLASLKQHEQLQSNEIPEMDTSQVISPFLANVPQLLYPQDKPEQELQGDDNICKKCVDLITDVQEAVKTNSSFVDNVISQIKKQCDQLQPGLAEMCRNYVVQYADLLVQMMMHMKPVDICSMIGLCPLLKSVPLQTLVPAKVSPVVKEETAEKITLLVVKEPPTCMLCELVISNVISLLGKNKTEESIKHALESVCSLLPKTYKDECTDFVDTYTDAVIDILLQEATPKDVCAVLGLCSNNMPFLAERITSEQLSSGKFCKVCELIVNYLDILLEKNSTEKEIEAALHKVCNFLPSSDQYQCNQLVTQYTSDFLRLLLQTMDPKFVCTQLHVCVSVKKPLLGTEECMWGPGYWCKSMETAERCNAVEHCKRHVWN